MEEKFCGMLLIFFLALEQLDSEIINDAPEGNAVLSRRKRFLVFPEGSSLQLVYCLTIPSIGMGNIFTIGWTAALAWELPNKPIHLYSKKEKHMERVDNQGSAASGGWAVQKGTVATSEKIKNLPLQYSTIKEYLTKPLYSNMRYTSAVDNKYWENLNRKDVDKRPVYDARESLFKSNHAAKEASSFYLHPVYKEAHRRTRRDLFAKLEKFLDAQRADGKACLLKAICEVGKATADHVGSFMEEIIKAIFRIKPYRDHYNTDEYDEASEQSSNCTKKYARCSYSIWSML